MEVQGLNSDAGNFILVTGRQRAALAAVAWNAHMTGNPAEFHYFASFYEVCVVFDNFKYQIQFNLKPFRASKLDFESEKTINLVSLL